MSSRQLPTGRKASQKADPLEEGSPLANSQALDSLSRYALTQPFSPFLHIKNQAADERGDLLPPLKFRGLDIRCEHFWWRNKKHH